MFLTLDEKINLRNTNLDIFNKKDRLALLKIRVKGNRTKISITNRKLERYYKRNS